MTPNGPVVNGGTGDYLGVALLFALAFFVLCPLSVWLADVVGRRVDEWLDRRHAQRRPRAHLHRAAPLPAQRSISPDPCPACGHRSWHDEGCGLLDRLDAPRRSDSRWAAS